MKFALRAAAVVFAATASPASAATVVYNGTNYISGNPLSINFTGVQDPNSSGQLTLTLTGTGGNDYNFTYSLLNTSTSPNTNISGFGFDVMGATLDLGTTVATGTYSTINSGSISGGLSVDVCLSAGPTCSGGASGGPTPGGTASGTFALEFTSLPSAFTLTQPVIRMQNTGPNGQGSDVGLPGGGAVPEPATWAMMLVGFTGIGIAMRRRRKSSVPQLV